MTALRLAVAVGLVALTLFVFRRTTSRTSKAQLPEQAIVIMNWMRGLAALAVLLGHARGLYMQDYEAVKSPSLPWKAYYMMSGLGHQAVMVFFILSGFLVGSTVLAQCAEQRWDFRHYLGRRLIRLYVVLIPGLLLTFLWDSLGMQLFGTDGLYGGELAARHLTMPDVRVTLSLAHLAGNLAFLQHLFIAPYGTNGPLWSLSYELWAYVLFPLLVRASVPSEPAGKRLAFVLLACAVLAVGGLKLSLYFGVWLLGAAVALWWHGREAAERAGWIHALAWTSFAAFVALGRSAKLAAWQADVLLGIATALLLSVVLAGKRGAGARVAGWNARSSAWLANFSYTLYVAHYPVLAFFFAAFMNGERWAPSPGSVLSVLAISLALLLGYAYPLSRLTEAHTDLLRARLSRRKVKRPATAPTAG